MAPHRSLARHQRTYRRLLLAYPRAFRQVYGADMVQVFGDRLREGREDRGRRATVVVWLRTLLDLFRSAPIQRMESSMSREAGFSILFLLLLATIVTLFALGSRIPAVVSLGVLVVTAVAFLVTGSLKKERSATRVPAPRFGPGQWWLILAAGLGSFEILAGVGQLIHDPTLDNAGGLAILGVAGLLVFAGIWQRTRSKSRGDWMITLGMLPPLGLFWLIVPPIAAIVVIVSAMIDSARSPKVQVT